MQIEVVKIGLASVFYLVVFGLVELLSRQLNIGKELTRKIVHIIAGVTTATLPYYMSMRSIQVLALLFVVVMAVSKKGRIFQSVHGVKRQTYGEFFFPLAVFVAALLFASNKDAYSYSLLVLGLSDGLASLVGQRFGKHNYSIGLAKKTYEGSMTFLAVAVIIGLFFSGIGVAGVVVAAVVLTAVEAVSPWGIDNLLLPVAAGALFLLA